jgi:VWFA-related protein
MRARRSVAAFAVSLVLAPGLRAAPDPASADTPPPSPFGEQIDVRVVNVEVVVTDGDGKRVAGLSPGDFTLSVDGKPVTVEFFTEVRAGNVQAPSAASTEAPGDTAAAVRPISTAASGTNYLVFVDDYFSISPQRDLVLEAMRRDLDALGAGDRMAVVAFDGGRLTPIAPWTSSKSDLAKALQRAIERPTRGFDRAAERRSFANDQLLRNEVVGDNTPLDLEQRMGELTGPQTAYGLELLAQIGATVDAASAAMRAFSDAPGRKVLLLLAGGWPYSVRTAVSGNVGMPRNELPEGERVLGPLTDTANLLGYTIYPVDVPGPQYSGPDAEATGSTDVASVMFAEQQTEDTLVYLAAATGGRPLLDGKRTAALTSANEDTRSFYWLGFVPSWKGDDRPHRLDVEVRPGLRARARSGFLDLSPQAETTMRLESALLLGSFPGTVAMPIQIGAPRKTGHGRYEVPLTLGLPVDVMTVVPVDHKYAARLELRFAASDRRGGTSSAYAIPVIPLELSSDAAPKAGGFVRHQITIRLNGRADHLVVAVSDPLSDRVATAEADLAMP